jgi:pyrophosphatase PpaX
LFDLDGTLADTHQLIFDTFNFVLRKYKSIEMTPKQILSYFGPPEEVCIRNMFGTDNFDPVWNDFIGYYSSHLNESTVFDGVRELLRTLKWAEKLVGVFTAKGTRTAELTLKYHNLRHLFDIVITGTLVKNHKPDPEGIILALKQLGIHASKTIVIGDSPSDCKAAASAGTDFIAVTYDSISRNRFDDIDCAKAASVADLAGFLLDGDGGPEQG